MQKSKIDAVEALDRAWDDVEKGIQNLGRLVKDVSAKDDPVARYEAYRTALVAIMDSYVNNVYADRKRPECLPWMGWLVNHGAPAADQKYSVIQIEPGASYRVWGKRGDAVIIDLQQYVGWFGLNAEMKMKSASQETFASQNIGTDKNGCFEFTLSTERPEKGDWFKLEPGTTSIIVREFFMDYARQTQSSTFHFEKIGFHDEGETTVPPNEAAEKIGALARSLKDWAFCFKMGQSFAAIGDNKFREDNYSAQGGQVNQRYYMMRYNLQPGEALICEWKVPEPKTYIDFVLYTDFLHVLNYPNRQVNLNNVMGHVDSDGIFRFVISRRDPLVANWLDLDGHTCGVMAGRAKDAAGAVLPTVKKVAESEILQHLPADTQMVTASERRKNLAIRRQHYLTRESR